MEAVGVILCHDIEEEGVSVVVEGLVVQEQLCQQAQVLGIQLERREKLSSAVRTSCLPSLNIPFSLTAI